MKKRVDKVVAYITCGDRLLVFSHRDFPEIGLQVPAGTLEANEEPAAAALREAVEETGLGNLRLVKYLGQTEYDISQFRPEIHTRHFYHLEAMPPVPERWQHDEIHPSGGDATHITYECEWVDLANPPALSIGFDALLHKITTRPPPPARKAQI